MRCNKRQIHRSDLSLWLIPYICSGFVSFDYTIFSFLSLEGKGKINKKHKSGYFFLNIYKNHVLCSECVTSIAAIDFNYFSFFGACGQMSYVIMHAKKLDKAW